MIGARRKAPPPRSTPSRRGSPAALPPKGGLAPRGNRLTMSLKSVWRDWRVKVHDILEVGDGNPIGRVVNVFLIVLIIANGLAFAAETVPSLCDR